VHIGFGGSGRLCRVAVESLEVRGSRLDSGRMHEHEGRRGGLRERKRHACGLRGRPLDCRQLAGGSPRDLRGPRAKRGLQGRRARLGRRATGPQGPPPGEAGAEGPPGAPGAAAAQPFIQLTPIAPGAVCPSGGTEISVSLSDVVTKSPMFATELRQPRAPTPTTAP
jgi:hypothetical protein